MGVCREHPWPRAIFFACVIAMCICVDILQHSAPLPFLPQQLEEAGYSAMEIASVMGSYYWSGFTGGMLITAYQVHGVLWGAYKEPTWAALRSHLVKLMIGLLLGGATLLVEARVEQIERARLMSMHSVHLACRFAQGFIGAFLFFFSYLLAAVAFEGEQQVFALTACTIFLNVAEVFGPFIGAAMFTEWGLNVAYLALAGLSVGNNVLLIVVYYSFPRDPEGPTERTALLDTPQQSPRTPRSRASSQAWSIENPSSAERCERLRFVVTHAWLIRSLLVIAPAAMVKSSFESILPLFGDNHGYTEYDVGLLFTVVALGFIVAAVSLGYCWAFMSSKRRAVCVASSLLSLGLIACVILLSYGVDKTLVYAEWVEWLNGAPRHRYLFGACLFVYGALLGLTHTAASLYLGEVVEELPDERSKGAANGIWNTGWELGGSLGFVIAGIADTDSWRQEQMVLRTLGIVIIVAGMAFAIMTCGFTGEATIAEQLSTRASKESRLDTPQLSYRSTPEQSSRSSLKAR